MISSNETTLGFSNPNLEAHECTNSSSFEKVCSHVQAAARQATHSSPFTNAASLDLELIRTDEDEGCDEIMDDQNLITHLAAIRLACGAQCKQPIVKQDEKCLDETIMERNAIGGKVAGKRGFIFDPALPSVGSALHLYGGCIPCDYVASAEGCTMGNDCGFCHFCPSAVDGENAAELVNAVVRRKSAVKFETVVREMRNSFNDRQKESRKKTVTNCGSRSHFTGACTPCIFIHKPRGCKDGEECIYCHLCDADMFRLKKQTRSEVGKRIKMIIRGRNSQYMMRTC